MSDEAKVPSPEEVVRSIEAALIAERKVYQDAKIRADASAKRIAKAERLVRAIRKTFDLPEREPILVPVRTQPKPVGIAVVVEDLACPDCAFRANAPQGLANHAAAKHGLNFAEVRRRQAARREGIVR